MLFPSGFLSAISGVDLLLPYHHVVSNEYLPHIRGLYPYKNQRQFGSDLDWLLKHFRPIHPMEVARLLIQKEPLPPKSFLLSFDDGFREVYDVIAPMLLQKGIPALFFINPAFIDNRELFYRCKLSLVLEKSRINNSVAKKLAQYFSCTSNNLRREILHISYPQRQKADELGKLSGIDFDEYLIRQKPFLNSGQIKQMQEQGFAFGGHSIDHPAYVTISLKEQLTQTIDSLTAVQTNGLNNPGFFAFPHEDHKVKQEFFSKIIQLKDDLLLFGTQNNRKEWHNHVLHRFNAENPEIPFSRLVKGILFYNSLLHLVKKEKPVRE